MHLFEDIFAGHIGDAGQVVLNTSLPLGTDSYSTILSVKPIAVTSSARVEFVVKGFNLSPPSTRYALSFAM